MTIRKTIWLMALAIVPLFSAHAQHFDWARALHSGHNMTIVKSSAIDAEGNLYILADIDLNAKYTVDANGDGQTLRPAAIVSGAGSSQSTLIAKINPDGDTVWTRTIHCGANGSTEPANLRLLGDTAVAFMASMALPVNDYPGRSFLYYLDTIVTWQTEYPIAYGDFDIQFVTGYIVLDLDGNLKEHHFLRQTYINYCGEDIVYAYDNSKLRSGRLQNFTFDVAADGTVYICWLPYDHLDGDYTVERGTIVGVKLWADNRYVGSFPASPILQTPRLLKFAPHFDTMLACREAVQHCYTDSTNARLDCTTSLAPMHIGPDGGLYMLASIRANYIDSVLFDSVTRITIPILMRPAGQCEYGLLCKYDTALNMQYLFKLDDAVLNTSFWNNSSDFHDVTFDADSGMVFILGTASHRSFLDTTSYYSLFYYENDTLVDLNGACFLALREEGNHPVLHSYGTVPATVQGASQVPWDAWTNGKFVANNNRVFMQTHYSYKLCLPNQTVQLPQFSTSYKGLCLVVLDYQGHCLYGIDYGSVHPDSGPEGMVLRDSVLYLHNQLYGEAHFGEHGGDYYGWNSAIARYVDTAFMTPYVYTGDTGDVRITVVGDEGAFVAYPNPFRQRVTIQVESGELKEESGIVTAWLTDMSGRREQVRLTAEGIGRYSLDLTSHPQATYLLTLTTASGKTHTVRLLKQSDIFSR